MNMIKEEQELFYASVSGDVDKLKKAVNGPAHLDINMKDDAGFTPLMRAAYHGHAAAVKWIIENGGSQLAEARRIAEERAFPDIVNIIDLSKPRLR